MTRVTILYNEPTLPAEHPDADSEHEIVYTVDEANKTLTAAGYRVERLGVHIDPSKIVSGIRKQKPDVVFNLFEGLPALGQTEAFAAGILEWLGVPHTGCPFQSLVLARDKPLTKRILKSAKLPTPKFALIENPKRPNRLGWPVIVKPANQDASVGIGQANVVTNAVEYREQVKLVVSKFGEPALVEQFIPGREFNIALYEAPELTMLPPFEYVFGPKNQWGIISYESKWMTDSIDFENTPPDFSPRIDADLLADIETLAKDTYRLIGCRDLARVDFRVTPGGEPFIIEVNPNPDFAPVGGLGECLAAAGISQKQLATQMVENALARGATKIPKPAKVHVEVSAWQ